MGRQVRSMVDGDDNDGDADVDVDANNANDANDANVATGWAEAGDDASRCASAAIEKTGAGVGCRSGRRGRPMEDGIISSGDNVVTLLSLLLCARSNTRGFICTHHSAPPPPLLHLPPPHHLAFQRRRPGEPSLHRQRRTNSHRIAGRDLQQYRPRLQKTQSSRVASFVAVR